MQITIPARAGLHGPPSVINNSRALQPGRSVDKHFFDHFTHPFRMDSEPQAG